MHVIRTIERAQTPTVYFTSSWFPTVRYSPLSGRPAQGPVTASIAEGRLPVLWRIRTGIVSTKGAAVPSRLRRSPGVLPCLVYPLVEPCSVRLQLQVVEFDGGGAPEE